MRTQYWILIIALLVSESSYCQDNCSAILKYGIFDLTTIKSENDFSRQFLDWFGSSQYNSTSDVQEAGFGASFLGFGIEGSGGSGSSSLSKNEFTHKIYSSDSAKSKYEASFKTANSTIIDAWSSCAQNKAGLVMSAIRFPGSPLVKLRIQVRKRSDRDHLDTLKMTTVLFPSYVKSMENLVNIKLSETDVNEFYFEIDTAYLYSLIFFKVKTNFSDYSATVELIPLKKVTSIKVTHENVIELTRKCADPKNKNVCRVLREYYSERAMEFAIANPGIEDFCYPQIIRGFDEILKLNKIYEEKLNEPVPKDSEGQARHRQDLETLELQIAQLAGMQEAIINGSRVGYGACRY